MSTLRADTIQSTGGGAATLTKQQAPKSWVTYYQPSGTLTILGSLNISSSTDTGTGYADFSVTNTMSDAYYAGTLGTSLYATWVDLATIMTDRTASGFTIQHRENSVYYDATADHSPICGVLTGDLA